MSTADFLYTYKKCGQMLLNEGSLKQASHVLHFYKATSKKNFLTLIVNTYYLPKYITNWMLQQGDKML